MRPIEKELINKRFGRLTVNEVVRNEKNRKICRCKCDCGNETFVEIANLKAGRTKICGCRMKEINSRYADITGKKYHNLIVESKTEKRKDKTVVWKCRCLKCGEYIEATKKQLDRGYVKDCGNHDHQNLLGKKIGRLQVLSFDEEKGKYFCKCSCGNYTYAERGNLITGHTKSCGCLQRQDNFTRIDGAVPPMLTSKLSKRNTSGYKGVSQTKKGRWVAYITLKRKRYTLGTFIKKEDAVKAREEAEEKLFYPILEKYVERGSK